MKKEVIVRLHASFEELVQHDETGNEYWLARDLQELLGYARWENFAKVIDKAQVACRASMHVPEDHFLDVTKMVDLGSGATRAIDDVAEGPGTDESVARGAQQERDQSGREPKRQAVVSWSAVQVGNLMMTD